MKIRCVGAGPAGLYFAISAKLRDPGRDITVVDRDPMGATYGWGVGYWDELLDILYANDTKSASELRAASIVWPDQQVCVGDAQPAHLVGYGFSLNRAVLLDILARRAAELGVELRHEQEVDDLDDLADADLVVAADGANSRVRRLCGDAFGTELDSGRNRYIWLGTDKVFTSFTFAFEQTFAGWVWLYAYPSSAEVSTCVVECAPETWEALAFETRNSEDTMRLLEKIFVQQLDGHSLISESRGRPAQWLEFTQVSNRRWHHENVVLVGDAAHTTHFTLGSGTSLAIMDAVALADALDEREDLAAALQKYDERRRAELRPARAAGRTGMAWFERVENYLDRGAVEFAFALRRRGSPQPRWCYQLHLVTQVPALRRMSRAFDTGRRWYLARRRGEAMLLPRPKATRGST